MTLDHRGQSATEFVLTAPLLFLIFFCLIQAAYWTVTCLAVQRSALAAARHAAREDGTGEPFSSPLLQAYGALVPLAGLHRSNLLSLVLAQVTIRNQGSHVVVEIRYPMPLWVPLAGKWFGERLAPPADLAKSAVGKMITGAFLLVGRKPPNLAFGGARFPYFRFVTFRAFAIREAHNHPR